MEDYLSVLRTQIVLQEVRLMEAFLPLKAPEQEGNVYELRNYRTQVGRVREWAGYFAEVMPARERHSPNVGAWVTEAGQPNEVCHLWAYPDLNALRQGPRRGRQGSGLAGVLEEERPSHRRGAFHDPAARAALPDALAHGGRGHDANGRMGTP